MTECVHIGVTGNPIGLAQVFMEGGRGECFNIEGDMTSQQISSDVNFISNVLNIAGVDMTTPPYDSGSQ